jgi:hypothetical protein
MHIAFELEKHRIFKSPVESEGCKRGKSALLYLGHGSDGCNRDEHQEGRFCQVGTIRPAACQFDQITSQGSFKDFDPSCVDLLNLLLSIHSGLCRLLMMVL